VINFYFKDTHRFPEFDTNKIKGWVNYIIKLHKKKAGAISFIFCNDDFLLDINQKFLNHDYYTDIITFNYCYKSVIEGEIYISLDTVMKNSEEYSVDFFNEILRVIIHGILHLIGYDDINEEFQQEMTKQEDYSLDIYYNQFQKKMV